jgi:HK97 family phage prohead protease
MRETWKEFELRGFDLEVDKAAAEQRKLTFTISSENVDRYGDIIFLDGWDLKAYKVNPVVLWAHDRSGPPIARAVKVWKDQETRTLKSTAEFPEKGIYPLADLTFDLTLAGFIHASSVGMRPKKADWAKEEPRKSQYGIDFFESELLEWSLVPVPANADALIEAERHFDLAPLRAWAARGIPAPARIDAPAPPPVVVAQKRIAAALGRRLLA